MFTEDEGTKTSNEPRAPGPESVTVEDADRAVDQDDSILRPGAFSTVYCAEDEENPYRYFCSRCGSAGGSADGKDSLECRDYGNVHLADEWDVTYLVDCLLSDDIQAMEARALDANRNP